MHNFIKKMTLRCLRESNSDATDLAQPTHPTQTNLYTICYRKTRRHISFFITPIILSLLIACGGGGSSSNTPGAPGTPDVILIPESVTGISLGFTALRVTWDDVPEAKCYEVYASRNLAADIAANGLNTAVISCADRLAASANSPSVSTPSVSTSAISPSAVSLAATAAPPGTVLVATVIPSNTSTAPNYYDATGLSPNSEYTYSIAACDSDSCSTAASGSVTTSGNKNGGDTIINSAAELNAIRADSSTLAGNYILAADIDLSSIPDWQPIGNSANPFTGSFDGGGHEIKGMTISGYEYAGLFGYVQGASISNFGVRVNNINSSSSSPFSYSGGLAGYTNNSVISNVYIDVAGNVSSFSSNFSASSYAGGLLGYADNSEISNLYVIVRGSISSTSFSSYAGGLLGYADGGLISNSYYSASRESSQQGFTNVYGTFQTLDGLRSLNASITGWDNTTWNFVNNTELPILFSLSSPDIAPPPIEAPSGFGDVTLKTLGFTSLNISWVKVSKVDYYEIYSSRGEEVAIIDNANVTSYTITGLAPNTGYTYRVRACNKAGCSVFTSRSATINPIAVTKTPQVTLGDSSGGELPSTLSVSWEEIEGVTSYQILNTVGENVANVTTTTTHTFTDLSLSNGTRYGYQVRGCADSDGPKLCGGLSPIGSAITIPASPSGVTATAEGITSIRISWDRVKGVAGYVVHNKGNLVTSINYFTTSYDVIGLSPNTAYTYNIRACNESGCSPASSITTTTPVAIPVSPSGVTFTALSSTSLSISWESIVGAVTYEVRDGDGLVTTISHPATSYTATGLSSNTEYTYRVRACNTSGCSDFVDIIAMIAIPVTPIGFTATASGLTSLSISWSSVDGAEYYQVSNNEGLVANNTHPNTSYTVTGLSPNTKYTYRVIACNSLGCSGFAPITVRTNAIGVSSAPRVTVDASTKGQKMPSLKISWEEIDGVTSYQILNLTGEEVATVPALTTNYIVANLSADTRYEYQVRGCYASEDFETCGELSEVGSGATRIAIPDSIINITAEAQGLTSISIYWESVDRVKHYEVHNSGGLIMTIRHHTTATEHHENSYTVTGLSPNTEYTYRVRGCNVSGCSAFANVAATTSVTPPPVTPPTVTPPPVTPPTVPSGTTSIGSAEELVAIRANSATLSGAYALTGNIDLSSVSNWQPIGNLSAPFTGGFDGRGYNISGISSSGYEFAGLFGYVENASISNAGVLVGSISSSSAASGAAASGGLIGYALNSRISNSYAIVLEDISSSSSSFSSLAGGLVGGVSDSQIIDSYAQVAGDISAAANTTLDAPFSSSSAGGLVGDTFGSMVSDSYALVEGGISSYAFDFSYAGGLIGDAFGGSITNSYAVVEDNISSMSSNSSSSAGGLIGSTFENSINNSYALVTTIISSSSNADSFSYAGGLVGNAFRGSITNSYAIVTGDISGYSHAGGLTGYSSYSSISNSYAEVKGDISSFSIAAGGLAGTAFVSEISNSYAEVMGSVSSSSSTSVVSYAGGLVGWSPRSNITNSYAVVMNDISSYEINSFSYAGGLVALEGEEVLITSSYYSAGNIYSSGGSIIYSGTSLTFDELRSLNATATGWDKSIWNFGTNDDFPKLRSLPVIDNAQISLITPPSPSNVNAIARSSYSVRISWDSSPKTLFYEVNNIDGLVATVKYPATSHTIRNLSGSTKYTYSVRACNLFGCSDSVNTSATTLAATIISSTEELAAIRANSDTLSGGYILTENIDLSAISNWQPIGNFTNAFTGSFDGNGYNISGISSSGYEAAGLFGYVENATIRNVGVLVGNISSSSSAAFTASGGLIGFALNSRIGNSYAIVSEDISSSSSFSAAAGGLVGALVNSQIIYSYAEVAGNISATTDDPMNSAFAGGLAGNTFGSMVSDSYTLVKGNIYSDAFDTSYAGGLTAYNVRGTVIDSYALVEGYISSSAFNYPNAGGLVGDDFYRFDEDLITNSYYSARRKSSQGEFTNTNGTFQTPDELRALTAAATGWNTDIWDFGTNNDLPILRTLILGSVPLPPFLAPPSDVVISDLSNSRDVLISWESVSGALYYQVHDDNQLFVNVSHPTTSYIATGLLPNVFIYLWCQGM